jgi:D-alanyl-D-alanine carboxypeptidase (penicillin-binding protein 5/6)
MSYSLIKTGDNLGSFKVNKGKQATVPLTAKHPYSILLKKGEASTGIRHELQLQPKLKAPIQVGQPIGKIIVYKGNQVLKEFPLESPVQVNKASLWDLMKRTTSHLFFVK